MVESLSVLGVSFILSSFCGIFLIPFLHKLKFGQEIREEGPSWHKKKSGTPTMGGIIFIIAMILATVGGVIAYKYLLPEKNLKGIFLMLGMAFAFGVIGFLDDYIKVILKRNLGLTAKQKFSLQFIVAVVFTVWFVASGVISTEVKIPFTGIEFDFGYFYIPFTVLVMLATVNSVNLTDGLDGLAGGLCFIAFIVFGILSIRADWLYGYEDIALCAFVIAGSILGFLFFNTHPAKIFMGDTGSLALGATLGAYAIMTRHELLLLVIGIVFAAETLSCILQIGYYKLTKKRLFPMTPIHHTLEKKGFSENDIVKIFWSLGLFAAMISLIYGVWL